MNKLDGLVKEHNELYSNIESLEELQQNDPDLLRMEEIMKEIEKIGKEDETS